MSVTSLRNLPPFYGPDSGNNSQSAKFAGLAERLRERTNTNANGPQATSIQDKPVAHDYAVTKQGEGVVRAGYADPTDASHVQSAFAQALRANGVAGGSPTSGNSGSQGNQSSRGTALYRLVSQMGNSDPSTSALLKSWNSIMQSGRDAGDAGAGALQDSLRSEPSVLESGSSLHLTA
jgi:hypothetical protein